MKTKRIKFLLIAGLFSKAAIMKPLTDQLVTSGICRDSDILCIDLEGLKNIEEAKNYIQSQIMILAKDGDDVVVIGHSAGGQLASHFLGAIGVRLVVQICAPSHNPSHYPWWMWFKTGKYFLKLLSSKAFAPDDKSSKLLFGRLVPENMRGKSAGTLVAQLNMGWLKGNPAPKKRRIICGNHQTILYTYRATGDKLITAKATLCTADRLGGYLDTLDHPDHYPILSSEQNSRVCEEIRLWIWDDFVDVED